MHRFKTYLQEKLITIGNKAYPKFGNVVILAGGAGSGKGFVVSNLLGLEGRVLDVDKMKTLALKSPAVAKRIETIVGKDISDIDLKNPMDVGRLHGAIADVLALIKKRDTAMLRSAAQMSPANLPNIIFDVTLKDVKKFQELTTLIEVMGYPKENIHLVWVLNDYQTAIVQNKQRERVVPDEIMFTSHVGAAMTMQDIINQSESIASKLNGDIWISFNKAGVDTELIKSPTGGSYIKTANAIKIKSAGSPQIRPLTPAEQQKIASYVPK